MAFEKEAIEDHKELEMRRLGVREVASGTAKEPDL